MKKIITLFACILAPVLSQASAFYACHTATSDTSSTIGGVCASYDESYAAGDTLIIPAGISYRISKSAFINGTVIVDSGASFEITASNFNLTINPGGRLIIKEHGTLYCAGSQSITNNGVFLIHGLLDMDGAGTLTLSGSSETYLFGTIDGAKTIKILGADLNGTGVINLNQSGASTISGSGTVNGEPIPSPIPQPFDLSLYGNPMIVWENQKWNNIDGIKGINFRVWYKDSYNTAINGYLPPHTGAVINENVTITIANNDVLYLVDSLQNNGSLVLTQMSKINGFGAISGKGHVTTHFNFTRSGWQYLGLPIKSGSLTLADLSFEGMGLNFGTPTADRRNIYGWDPTNSSWSVPVSSTSIAGQPFIVYIKSYNMPVSMSVTIPNADFNNEDISLSYEYSNPQGNDPGYGSSWTTTVHDGWNMVFNPFASVLDWSKMTLPAGIDNAVYIWDGNQYHSYVNGSLNGVERILPGQAFFVRSNGGNGNINFQTSSCDTTDGTSFMRKTATNANINLTLSSKGYDNVVTELIENPLADPRFESDQDALYLVPAAGQPHFFTASTDSLPLSINQLPIGQMEQIFLSFYHKNNGTSFTIHMDEINVPMGWEILLEDLFTGDVIEIQQRDYTFVSNTAAPVQRFRLVLMNYMGSKEWEARNDAKAWVNGDLLQVEIPANGQMSEVRVYTLDGKLIHSMETRNEIAEFYLDNNGMYIVEVIQGSDRLTTKVVK
ncbi:MAG: T9SS type A sorting domain-containing protein [Bacteroidota bacterium]|nr:T9SS type A sorting domain-containing protein [Bacteroidota bacterium]